jgi:hypothetical protein
MPRRNPPSPLTIGIAVGAGILAYFLVRSKTASAQDADGAPYQPVQYPPNSPELIALLQEAAKAANLPVEWASMPATHTLINRESGGWIGIPNYTIPGAKDKATWPDTVAKLRAGKSPPGKSDAAGLGQMQPSNMRAFAPSGIKGYGVPIEEAIGFLKYVHSRYGDPQTALSMHGKLGVYVNTRTGKNQEKKFKEGY